MEVGRAGRSDGRRVLASNSELDMTHLQVPGAPLFRLVKQPGELQGACENIMRATGGRNHSPSVLGRLNPDLNN